MSAVPRISEAEWEVMKTLWTRSPLAAQDVIEELASRMHWNHRTIRTLLSRLVKKGALNYSREGRAYLYRPKVTENECVKAISESFLDRVFGGALQPMLSHFVSQKKLSKKEIAALKRILDEP
jgi:BlaI family transcriptional regulator, penicillinase repressor